METGSINTPKHTTTNASREQALQMDFEHHLKALVYYHLEGHVSAQELLQELQENDFARQYIPPPDGIEKSSFSEAITSRGLEQFLYAL
jgi:hypothetical protein